MKTFFPKKEAVAAPNSMNQFGAGTVLSGDLTSESDVRIDGKVIGNVTTKAKLVVGASGIVDGNVVCQNAHIEGRVNGKVTVGDLLVLRETAYVDGDIAIKKLVVEDGATFNGRCVMGTPTVMSMDTASEKAEPAVRAIGQR